MGLNRETIAELRALEMPGAPSFLSQMIDLYLRDASGLIRELRASFTSRDMAVLHKAAHQLKGSSGNVGADELTRLSRELQAASMDGDWTRCADLVPKVEREYASVETELRAERGT